MTGINTSTPSHKTAGPDDPEFFAKILSSQISDVSLDPVGSQGALRNNPNPRTGTLPARLNFNHRIRRLIDILSCLAIFDTEQVAAVTAQIEPNATGLDTHVYIAYNRDLEPDMEIKVIKHIGDLVGQLKAIKAGASSDIGSLGDEGAEAVLDLCRTIDAFSGNVLRSHLEKRRKAFEKMIEEITKVGKTYFTADELEKLRGIVARLRFIMGKEDISEASADIAMAYQKWVDSGYMPCHRTDDDGDDDDEGDYGGENEEESNDSAASTSNSPEPSKLSDSATVPPTGVRLFKKVKIFMETRKMVFDMERWIARIGSTYRRCSTLVQLRVSNSLREVFQGPISVQIIPALKPLYQSLSVPLDHSNLHSVISAIRQDFGTQHVEFMDKRHLRQSM